MDCELGCKHHPRWLDKEREALADLAPPKIKAFKDGITGCPRHVLHDELENGLVTPYKAEYTSPGWVFCHYKCPIHGDEWTMGWAAAWTPDELAVYV